MSRTYRRKSAPDWWAYKHHSFVRPRDSDGIIIGHCTHYISEENKPKSIAHLHSDMYDWNGRYLKSVRQETESEHRQYSKNEIHKFMTNSDYEYLIDRKRKLPWW